MLPNDPKKGKTWGEIKKKSYTINPQAAKFNAVRCLVNVDKFSLMTDNSATAVTCQLRVSSVTVCVHRNSLQCCQMTQRRGKRGKIVYNETASDAQRRTMPRQQRAFESDLATCTGCGLLSNSVANAQFFHAFNYVYKGT